ncbi:MAG: PD-(D/E)XK nuclease family protein, partial [Actinomycetota bacterium]
IYGFRGADVAGLLEFTDRFRRSDGLPAPYLTLGVSRRAGAGLLAPSRAVAVRISTPGLPASAVQVHRALVSARSEPGSAQVRTFSSPAQEATGIADVLRRSHLIDEVPWSQMAVVVRSARRSIPTLRRALVAAGVPVAVAGDEIPLVDDPAVTPMLQLLRGALDPTCIDEEWADALLISLGGADVMALRKLRRELLALERAAAGRRPSGHLIVELVRDGLDARLLSERVRRPVERLAAALAAVRAGINAGDAVDAVLWSVWDRSLLRARLVRAAAGEGQAAIAANRDLDVIVALFEAASRFVDQLPQAGVRVFLDDLDAQEIPAGSLSERSAPGESVRLLTTHRSKGLEWDVVVVAAVQDGQWPDLRRRGSVLGSEDLQRGELPATTSHSAAALVEERRLFYVAVTRARQRLVVTAVDSGEDAGERPSRFVHELGIPVPERPAPQPHVLSLRSLVGELRHAAVDPDVSPALRTEAVASLAALAAPGGARPALVPTAHPDSWWGLRELTDPGSPLVPAGEPAPVSPSAVDQFSNCPLQWFLERKAGVRSRAGERQTFGNLLHAIAEIAGSDPALATPEAMLRLLDEGWPQLEFEAPWYADHQYRMATQAVRRLADFAARDPNTFVAAEEQFSVDIANARLGGKVDRLDVDEGGAAVVVDYKTSASKAGPTKIASHPQLALYQLAVEHGAFPDLAVSGGAQLVQLRAGDGDAAIVERQPPLATDPQLRANTVQLLEGVADAMIAEEFPARPGKYCQLCTAARACPAQPEGEQVQC